MLDYFENGIPTLMGPAHTISILDLISQNRSLKKLNEFLFAEINLFIDLSKLEHLTKPINASYQNWFYS